jgi:hypothetical protein
MACRTFRVLRHTQCRRIFSCRGRLPAHPHVFAKHSTLLNQCESNGPIEFWRCLNLLVDNISDLRRRYCLSSPNSAPLGNSRTTLFEWSIISLTHFGEVKGWVARVDPICYAANASLSFPLIAASCHLSHSAIMLDCNDANESEKATNSSICSGCPLAL